AAGFGAAITLPVRSAAAHGRCKTRASRVAARKARTRIGRNAPAWGFLMALMFSRPDLVPRTQPRPCHTAAGNRPNHSPTPTCPTRARPALTLLDRCATFLFAV